MTKTIYLLRHGETEWNKRKLFQGQTDIPLDEAGIEQARACRMMAESLHLAFDGVYASPLKRALETTEIVSGLPKEKICTDKRLMEMDFGPIDGTPFDKESPECGLLFQDPDRYVPAAGAESFPALRARLASFFDDLADAPGERILVGSHGCAIRCMLVNFGYLKLADIWQQHIPNCTLIEVHLAPDHTWQVGTFHEISQFASKHV
ncbi:MAG: histidine phosphatase family protein [Lachnospiraceae bacterium]